MFMTTEDIDRQCPRNLNATGINDLNWQQAPFDDACLRRFFQRMNTHLKRYNNWEEMLYTTIYILISLFALIGNGAVILAVIRRKEMRTNRNVLIVNLALSNLMLAITTIPFLWLPSIDFEFPYSRFFCKFANALPGSNIYSSTLTISVMAIDRYYSVKRMTLSDGNQQCLRAIIVSFLIWTVSFLLSFPLLVYYDVSMLYVFKDVMVYDAANNITHLQSYGWRQCRLTPGGAKSDDPEENEQIIDAQARMIQLAMSLMQVLFLYVIPIVVLSIFNVKLTQFLKLNAKQMQRTRESGSTFKKDTFRRESYYIPARSASFAIKESPTKKSSMQMSSDIQSVSSVGGAPPHNGAISPAERASDRRRSRTTMLLISMAGSYAVLWLPFTLVSVIIDLNILSLESSAAIIERIDQSCKLISILSICVNPFLYGFLNTNFRREFTDIFNTIVRCSHKRRRQSIKSRGSAAYVFSTGQSSNERSFAFFESLRSRCGSIFSLLMRQTVDQPPTVRRQSQSDRSKSVSSDAACVLQIFATGNDNEGRQETESRFLAVPLNGNS